MKLKTFSLTMGETINMGNFNNVRYEVSGTIEILPGASIDTDLKAREEQIEELRAFLRIKAIDVRRQIKGTEKP